MPEIFLVYGLGRSGRSALRWLRKRGKKCLVWDDAADVREKAAREGLRLWNGEEVSAVIVSPGIAPHAPILRQAAEKGWPVWTEMTLFFREFRGRAVGVTGTKGKSTLTLLLTEILRSAGFSVVLGGNYGRPATALPEAEWVVLEISSFQAFYAMDFRLHSLLLTNLHPDHLDWHGTLEAYYAAKCRLVEFLEPEGFVVLPRALAGTCAGRARELVASPWEGDASPALRRFPELAGLAAVWAKEVGIREEVVQQVFRKFSGLPHRLEWVGLVGGRKVYNDSKATTPEAVLYAVEQLRGEGPLHLILGGSEKGLSVAPLRRALQWSASAALTGPAGWRWFQELADNGAAVLFRARNLAEAVDWTYAVSKEGEVVLLSPGSASFDEFRNYAERGQKFRELVARWEDA